MSLWVIQTDVNAEVLLEVYYEVIFLSCVN